LTQDRPNPSNANQAGIEPDAYIAAHQQGSLAMFVIILFVFAKRLARARAR
jgi:uncharacterized membrane protein